MTFYLPTQGNIEAGATRYITPGLVVLGFLTILGLITALSRVFDAVTDPLIASLSAVFYPFVSGLIRKFGKKKLVICGFWDLALAYLFAVLIGILPLPGVVFGVLICEITASSLGLRIVAIVAVVFCLLGAVILALYNEKKIMKTIEDKKNAVK